MQRVCKIRKQKFCVEVSFLAMAVISQLQSSFLSSKTTDHKQKLYEVSSLTICMTDTTTIYYPATKYSRQRLKLFNT